MSETAVKSSADLPGTWVIVAIGDVAILSPKSNVEDVGNEDLVHFIPMAAVKENFLGIDISQLRLFGEVRKGYTSFSEGDVLFAKITPCMENGKGGLVPHLPHVHAYGSTEFHVLTPTQALLPRWLAYYLSQPGFRKVARHNMTGTAGQMRVPSSWLGAVGIPVAPIPEQTRIVAKLEELLSDLDAGVVELKAAQKKLGQYRQSLLKAAVEGALTAQWRAAQKVGAGDAVPETGAQLLARILQERRARWEAKQMLKFESQGKVPPKDWQKKCPEPVQPDISGLPELPEGWVWASVDCLLADIETGKSFKCDERSPAQDEIGVVKVSAVSWGKFDQQESKTCTDESRVNPDLLVKTGDFLFSRANTVELVGACVIAKVVSLNVMLSDKILRLVFVEDELKPWLLFLLRSKLGRKQIEVLATGNQKSMKNIGQERIRSIVIPIAPKHEMNMAMAMVAQAFDATSQQIVANERLLKQSAAQRKNILKAAFSGQLVPQDPNDEPASVLLERIRAERAERDAEKKPRGRKAKAIA